MNSYSFIHLPLVEMRETSSENSKVVSQALFGEEIQIQECTNGWARIATPDGYFGWVPGDSFFLRNEPYKPHVEVTRLKAHVYFEPDTEFGPALSLPYGSKLELIDALDYRWLKIILPDGREGYIQKGDLEPEDFDLLNFAKKFLGLPYTWGGRSSFGYDCSGYVQMLYARMGIQLPRDARQQIYDPRGRSISLEQLVLGDLIFWGKSEIEIKHVGMYIGQGEFIHTSSRENKPYLRISKLTDHEWSSQNGAFYPYRAARRYL